MNYLNDLFLEESLSKQTLDDVVDKNKRDKIINEAIEFLNEAYIGKTDTLLKIEDQLNIIRGKLNRFGDFDRLKEVQKLNRLFEKQFGMDVFALHMEPDNVYNAYTMVIANNFDVYKRKNFSSYLVADRKDGYRFKTNDFCISAHVYYGLLSDPDFTDGEILAILLHELGHNFADFLDDNVRIWNQLVMNGYIGTSIMKILLYSLTLRYYKAGRELLDLAKNVAVDMNNSTKNKIENLNQKNSERHLIPALKGTVSAVRGFFDICYSILIKINPLYMGISKLTVFTVDKVFGKMLKKATVQSIPRRNEVIADKFAAVYGYGPELASALQKMSSKPTKSQEIIENIPLFGESINKFWEKLYITINEFDCHPHDIQRINECIYTLENELKQKDMDPKMKSVIMRQIKEMKDNVEESKQMINKDPNNIKYIYDAYVANELPGAVTKEIEDDINEELNKALSESSSIFDNYTVILTEGSLNRITMGMRIKSRQDLDETLKKHEYPGILNFALKQKDIDDLRYLRADAYVGIKQIEQVKKAIQEKNTSNKFVKEGKVTVRDCDLTIKWFKEKYIPAITNRIKELS